MVGQRAVAVPVAGSRPGGVLARPVERADRPATGAVSPRLVVLVPVLLVPVLLVPVLLVPVLLVKARGLTVTLLRATPRGLRRGFRELRRPTGRGGRPARLPKDLACPVALAARLRVTNRAAARPRAMVRVHAGRRARRAPPPRRERVRRTAGRARAGTPRVPALMTMSGIAAGGPRPPVSSVARPGRRPRVSSVVVRVRRRVAAPGRPPGPPRAAPLGHRQVALPVTGPELRGRTDPGRRATRMVSVTVGGLQIATRGVMTAVRLRARVPADRTATTVLQRATGRVAPAGGMAPRLTAASVLTTAARPVTVARPVTGDRAWTLPLTGPPVAGRRARTLALISRPVGAMARRRGLPAADPGTARRNAT